MRKSNKSKEGDKMPPVVVPETTKESLDLDLDLELLRKAGILKRMEISERGTVLLDPNNPAHRDWYEGDEEE